MLVVPIHKDTVKTQDGSIYKVVEYTNYKDGGPAVYAKLPNSSELVLVYFFDIEAINDTRVEYKRGAKVFHALGKIKRDQHLPQPGDKIIVLTDSITDEDGKESFKVKDIKLKSRSLGVNKGLFVISEDGNAYRLKQILDIVPALGTHEFNKEKFLSSYKDYTGV